MQIKTDYSNAITRKYPEQIVLSIAKDMQEKYNPMTLGWTMITSGKPPMMAISVGQERYSLKAIKKNKEFVICFPSIEMKKEVKIFGTKSGRDVDKIALCKTKTQKAQKIDCVLFSDAVANFECVLESELKTGDHTLFVGRIVAAHSHQDPKIQRLYNLGDESFKGLG